MKGVVGRIILAHFGSMCVLAGKNGRMGVGGAKPDNFMSCTEGQIQT